MLLDADKRLKAIRGLTCIVGKSLKRHLFSLHHDFYDDAWDVDFGLIISILPEISLSSIQKALSMPSKYAHYFDSDPDWERFASDHGCPLKTAPYPPVTIDLQSDREAQKISEGEWETQHPLRDVGYSSHSTRIKMRDGEHIWVKVCHSTRVASSTKLPLLFVTHGGGWVQGTAITEEAWLLWPLLQRFDLVTVSVEYRLAPESAHPTYNNDCLDALKTVIGRSEELGFDPTQVILTGSSAGGCLALSLAQQCRDANISIKGVISNVPITCDPRHFPKETYEYTSYDQCRGALLSSDEMVEIWRIVVPDDEAGKSSMVSPLLGNTTGLPSHAIFVAGQDTLRDEAIAYAEKLKDAGVNTALHIYQGVPHNFAEYVRFPSFPKFTNTDRYWELKLTQKFWGDVRAAFASILQQ